MLYKERFKQLMNDDKEIKKQKRVVVNSSELSSLPLKRRKFIQNYIETGKKRDSAIKAGYAEVSAHVTANRILKSDKVLSILNDSVEQAEDTITDLMSDENPAIRLAASREVLDRTLGKSVQRSESVRVNVTVESMLNDND
jgi:phage terminase small subunit